MDFHYTYTFPSETGNDAAIGMTILLIYLLFIGGCMILAVAGYVLRSVALYVIGKRMGKENPWMAFIPFARQYFHGSLAGEIDLNKKKIKNPGLWKLLLPIICGIATWCICIFVAFAVVMSLALTIGNSAGAGLAILSVVLLYVLLIIVLLFISALISVLDVLVNIKIVERFTTHNMAIVHSVLSLWIPLYEPIMLFVMRNRKFNPGMEPEIPVRPPVYTEEAPVPPVHPEEETPAPKTDENN